MKKERRAIKCLALIRITKEDKLATTSEKAMQILEGRRTELLWGLSNRPFPVLVQNLNRLLNRKIPQPILGQTGYQGNIDIIITNEALSAFDLPAIKRELN